MALISLAFGLVATGTLSLAVSVDYWLFTIEPVPLPAELIVNSSAPNVMMVKTHSGFWRACPYYDFGKFAFTTFSQF